MKLFMIRPLMLGACAATLLATTGACAVPTAYYSASTVSGLGNPQSFGGVNNTGQSVAFELLIDFTTDVDTPTAPMVLWEAGATGNGAALVLLGDDLHFFAGNDAGDVASGAHNLTATTNGVQILSVYEIGGGTNGTDEKLSIYVNGSLIASADADTANAWAGSDPAGLGLEQGGARTRYVGTGLFDDGTIINFPNDNIDLNLYVLGQGDNTVENILVPEPASLALLGLGGLLFVRRRRG